VQPADAAAYPTTARYNEVPSRLRTSAGTTVQETFGYDGMSRLLSWDTVVTPSPPVSADVTRDYAYDGSSRLRRVERSAGGVMTVERYHYDVDDGVPWEEQETGGVVTHVFRHDGWERRGPNALAGVVTEEVLPMASLRGTSLVVRLQEPDGHAYRTWTSGSGAETQELLGAFGLRLWDYQSNADNWVIDGFHGEEVNRSAEVIHKGARHLVLRDGMWMQPEPLLYLGLTNGNLRTPLGYTGVYAAGDPNALQDRSGRMPALVLVVGGGGAAFSATAMAAVGDGGVALLQAVTTLPPGATTSVDADERRADISAATAAARSLSESLPANPDDLLGRGYRDVSHPDAAAAGHRTFENPETGDVLRFDKGKPGRPGHAGNDHYHRENPSPTGKVDAYLDRDGNPVPDGSDASHLYPSGCVGRRPEFDGQERQPKWQRM
jgi:hypothetical protein